MIDIPSSDTHNLLQDIPLFKGLGPAELEWIARRAHRRRFTAGMPVLLAEQPGEAIYIIISGTVKIYIEQSSSRDVVLSIVGAGDLLGEISLLDNDGHSATAVTLEDSLMLWMDNQSFLKILADFPLISQNLVRILARRLRMNNELIRALAMLDVYGRVARQLAAFAEKYGEKQQDGSVLIPISLTQTDIADLVGASRKRVNQVMGYFREQEFIFLDQAGKIVVRNHSALMKCCE